MMAAGFRLNESLVTGWLWRLIFSPTVMTFCLLSSCTARKAVLAGTRCPWSFWLMTAGAVPLWSPNRGATGTRLSPGLTVSGPGGRPWPKKLRRNRTFPWICRSALNSSKKQPGMPGSVMRPACRNGRSHCVLTRYLRQPRQSWRWMIE